MAIQKRKFGRTGHESSAVIFGAAALWNETQEVADKTLDLLLEHGINHIDVAPRYGNAEEKVGSWMKHYRKSFFLATKTAERSYKAAQNDLYRSLELLKTDYIDLIQLHSLTHPDEWKESFKKNGALEALKEARKKGFIRYIGVTGHGWTAPAMHRNSLDKFDFDSVLMPWNWHVAHYKNYAKDFDATLKICKKRNIAIQTIKSIAKGAWSSNSKKNYTTWYEPVDDKQSIYKLVHWVLGRKEIFLNSVGDVSLLPIVLEAAEKYVSKPTEEDMILISNNNNLSSIYGI